MSPRLEGAGTASEDNAERNLNRLTATRLKVSPRVPDTTDVQSIRRTFYPALSVSVLNYRQAKYAAALEPSTPVHKVIEFDRWQFNTAERMMTREDGENVRLTRKEALLLNMLLMRPGNSWTRDELLRRVSGREWNPYDRSLDVLIGQLRKKLEREPRQPELIQTVRGVGYCINVNVRFL